MFEQEFMEIQSEIISLCVEYSHGLASHIFVYCYMNGDDHYFNAFFRIRKETWSVEELEYPEEVAAEFRSLIQNETSKLPLLFDQYKREAPVQYKIHFKTKGNKLESDLKYKKEMDFSMDPQVAFDKWHQSMKRKIWLI